MSRYHGSKHKKSLRRRHIGKPCHYCKVKKADTLDHMQSYAASGNKKSSNIVGACKHCNLVKSHCDYDLFIRFISLYGIPENVKWFSSTNRTRIVDVSHMTQAYLEGGFPNDKRWFKKIIKKNPDRAKRDRILRAVFKTL